MIILSLKYVQTNWELIYYHLHAIDKYATFYEWMIISYFHNLIINYYILSLSLQFYDYYSYSYYCWT